MTKRQHFKDKNPVAYFRNLLIYSIVYGIEDEIYFTAPSLNPKTQEWEETYHKSRIYYHSQRAYFKYRGARVYLDECLKIA